MVVDGDGLGGLLCLAEHVVLRPLQGLLVAGGTHEDITTGGDNLLHTVLAVVRFQLRQFLETQRHRHLVGTSRTNQTVDFMEVERRQLIHDNGNR